MNRLSRAALFAVLALAIALPCAPARADDPLRLGGSPFVSALFARLAAAYDPDCGPRRMTLQGDGPERGLSELAKGRLDAVVLTFDPTPGQLAALGQAAASLRLTPLGADAVAVVVHRDNPVTDLGRAELRLILEDKLNNWKLVGGDDRQIVVISRDASTALADALRHGLLEGAPIRPDAIIQATSEAVSRMVERTEPAMGFVFASEVRPTLKALSVDGAAPSADAAATGVYPLARTVYLAHLGDPSPKLARFLAFLRSAKGQDILRQNGFAPPQP